VRPHPSSLLNNSGFIAEVVDFLSRRGNAELVQSSPRSVLDDILDADVVISDHSSVSPFALWLDRPLIMYDETCLGAWSDFVQRAAVLVKNGRELSENVAKILCGVDQERLGREEFRARAVLFNPDVLKDIGQAVEEVNRK
jgi:CDP-glycerol glycerophosphotransferase (TagB/SpsB family)